MPSVSKIFIFAKLRVKKQICWITWSCPNKKNILWQLLQWFGPTTPVVWSNYCSGLVQLLQWFGPTTAVVWSYSSGLVLLQNNSKPMRMQQKIWAWIWNMFFFPSKDGNAGSRQKKNLGKFHGELNPKTMEVDGSKWSFSYKDLVDFVVLRFQPSYSFSQIQIVGRV